MIAWSLIYNEASLSNESFSKRHRDVFEIPLFPDCQKKSLIISEKMLRDAQFLTHFVKNGLVLDAV